VNVLAKVKLAFQVSRLLAVFKEANVNWKLVAQKAARDLLVTIAAVGGSAVLVYYQDPEHLKLILGVLPQTLQLALIPILSALITAALNALKHWGEGQQK
jgi:hypothetical protein